MIPECLEKAASDIYQQLKVLHRGGGNEYKVCRGQALTDAMDASLEQERVFRSKSTIEAKSSTQHPPTICSVRASLTWKLPLV